MLRDLGEQAAECLLGTRRIAEINKGLSGLARDDGTELTGVDLNLAAEQAIRVAQNEIQCRARLVRDFDQVPLATACLRASTRWSSDL